MMKIFNSLSKQIELIEPYKPGIIGMYACGPTVYDYPHIGHGRKYVNDDVLRRALTRIAGLKVNHVQNITDVGHLVSDGDEGEDKLEKGARKYGKTVWEVASEYTDYFFQEMDILNVLRPTISCKATDHIVEQVKMIEELVERDFAYVTKEAVYFDVTKAENYGQLFGQDLGEKMVGVREEVETDNSKKNPADFALWFMRVGKYEDHVMHWQSPWGDGFPGWHIECSAMSRKYLGDQFEIHTGGEDHISIHHPNEIAQSEAATGKTPFVKYWFHSAFLMVDGKKMSKSLGNVYKVADIIERGYDPMALRYYYLSTHYRKQMNFTWEGMEAAANAYKKLREQVEELMKIAKEMGSQEGEHVDTFIKAVEEDLNIANALAALWEGVRSDVIPEEKLGLVSLADEVLGLRLIRTSEIDIPKEVIDLKNKREDAKANKDYQMADKLRDLIYSAGFEVRDTADGQVLKPR